MGYINDFRAKLTALIEDGRTEEAVKFVADKVLESYHNGADMIANADPADVRKAERATGRAQVRSIRATHNAQRPTPSIAGKGRHYQS
jgi:predicted subunit of tRNA(5-methylaminomethyl-2-thiouridylate) methyltransferase